MPDTIQPNDQHSNDVVAPPTVLVRDLPPSTPVTVTTTTVASKNKKISRIKLGLRTLRFVLVVGGGTAAGVSILRPVTVEAGNAYAMTMQDGTTDGLWNAFRTGVQETASPKLYEAAAEYNISFATPLSFLAVAQDITATADRFQEIGYAALNVVASPVIVGMGIGKAEFDKNYSTIGKAVVREARQHNL